MAQPWFRRRQLLAQHIHPADVVVVELDDPIALGIPVAETPNSAPAIPLVSSCSGDPTNPNAGELVPRVSLTITPSVPISKAPLHATTSDRDHFRVQWPRDPPGPVNPVAYRKCNSVNYSRWQRACGAD
jgi:hypothetical protein